MNIDAINEAAENFLEVKGCSRVEDSSFWEGVQTEDVIEFVLSDVAKQYWFEQFKAEQKQTELVENDAYKYYWTEEETEQECIRLKGGGSACADTNNCPPA